MMTFSQLLVRSGLRKTELAAALGLSAGTVSRWGDDAPRYAVAWLELYVEVMRYRP